MARHAADSGGVDVRGRHDRDDAAHLFRGIHIDAADAGVRMRRAHERGRRLTRLWGIGDKTAVATHEPISEWATLAHSRPLTDAGATVGTLAYMSPEQIKGEPVDARTDIFSLGLVLYGMATGAHAFPGQTGAEISAAILTQVHCLASSSRSASPVRVPAVTSATTSSSYTRRTLGNLRTA